jgi:hypothetical protein
MIGVGHPLTSILLLTLVVSPFPSLPTIRRVAISQEKKEFQVGRARLLIYGASIVREAGDLLPSGGATTKKMTRKTMREIKLLLWLPDVAGK